MSSSVNDHAKDNRVAVLICILFIYVLYHLAFVPHLLFQNDVITHCLISRPRIR